MFRRRTSVFRRRRRHPLWRVLRVLLLLLLAVVAGGLLVGCLVFSGPRYRGPVSDHFDGKRFLNPGHVEHASFFDLLRWMKERERGDWGPPRDEPPGPPPPAQVGGGDLRVTFVNHSTVLLQLDGRNILTDPIWSERCSPLSWVGPRRVRPPGIRFEDLPRIDAVVLSHNHYDHLDLPTLKRLAAAHDPQFVTGLGVGALLTGEGLTRVRELDWWQADLLPGGLRVTAVPAQHFSSRGLCDRDATLWVGYVIQGSGGPVYFAGDTGWGPHFAEIRARFGPPRLALIPIGAFRPEWFMSRVHVSPGEALEAHRVLEASTSVGIHFGTFRLADDGEREPVEKLQAAVAAAGEPAPRFWVLGFGEGREVPPLATADVEAPR